MASTRNASGTSGAVTRLVYRLKRPRSSSHRFPILPLNALTRLMAPAWPGHQCGRALCRCFHPPGPGHPHGQLRPGRPSIRQARNAVEGRNATFEDWGFKRMHRLWPAPLQSPAFPGRCAGYLEHPGPPGAGSHSGLLADLSVRLTPAFHSSWLGILPPAYSTRL